MRSHRNRALVKGLGQPWEGALGPCSVPGPRGDTLAALSSYTEPFSSKEAAQLGGGRAGALRDVIFLSVK